MLAVRMLRKVDKMLQSPWDPSSFPSFSSVKSVFIRINGCRLCLLCGQKAVLMELAPLWLSHVTRASPDTPPALVPADKS